MKSIPLHQHPVAIALCRALFPAGDTLPAADTDHLLTTLEQQLQTHTRLRRSLQAGLLWLDQRYRLSHGRPFRKGSPLQQSRFIQTLADTPVSGKLLRLLSLPFKMVYLQDDALADAVGCRPAVQLPAQLERFRWQQQITAASECSEDVELEADVVVIGSGAGGAAAAYELASRGLAVVILEEGQYYDRRDFNGKLSEVIPKLYRSSGATVATGNATIPVPVGCNVGGTTTINSGTCMRTPQTVLDQWQKEGRGAFDADSLSPWFDQVEDMLKVQRASEEAVGPIQHIIARGAHTSGHTQTHRLMRNAEGCDGQGLCQFGCPTDAKQSTNVSYIPRALERGAFLYCGFRADRLLRDGNTITGVVATGLRQQDTPISLTIKARHVVVAMGTLFTPQFLKQQGIRNAHLGRHLTLHPVGVVTAHFPNQELGNGQCIPQGYGVADLADEGLMFEGGTPPLLGHGALNNLYGKAWVQHAERFPHTAYFGFMIRDTSEGRVYRGPSRGLPLIRYRMNRRDFRLFLRGIHTLATWYLDSGAREVQIPGPSHITTLSSKAELERFMKQRHKPADFLITAYHPLGTARLGATEGEGVCDPLHQVFGHVGLSVMDGACVPSSLGANPQVTIMALASRAASQLADRLLAESDTSPTSQPYGEYA